MTLVSDLRRLSLVSEDEIADVAARAADRIEALDKLVEALEVLLARYRP